MFKCGLKIKEMMAAGAVLSTLLLPSSALAGTLPHGLGAKLEPVDPSQIRTFSASPLPSSVSLKADAPTPGDQGQVGSCVTWATGYTLMGWYAKKQGRTGAPYAPMFIYSQVNGGVDNGTYPSAAYNILAKQGVPSQAVYTQGNYDWRTQPTSAEKADAVGHKAAGLQWITGGNYGGGESVKVAFERALASGHPATLSMEVFEPFLNLDAGHSVLKLNDVRGTTDEGGHEVTAVGYNSTGLVIENSWGTSWGKGGFATLAWDFVESYVADGAIVDGFADLSAPSVKSVSPATLSVSGGQLTVTGAGFAVKALTASVVGSTGKTKKAKVVSSSTNQVVLSMPAEPAGVSQLKITTPLGLVTAPVVYKKL